MPQIYFLMKYIDILFLHGYVTMQSLLGNSSYKQSLLKVLSDSTIFFRQHKVVYDIAGIHLQYCVTDAYR